ncbi:hypothetical protein KIPB_017276, partial [Kipferlia bialata]
EKTGVFVQASTLGSLEALLDFLQQNGIPVSGFAVGPVYKQSVLHASIMHDRKRSDYAVILT